MSSVQKHTLSNGLTVLLESHPHHHVSCVLAWVKVGYFDEPDHLTGVSHVIEHMLFKGTPSRGVGKIATETKELGGYLNAGTIYEHTSYYIVVPKENTLAALDIQLDALKNSLFDATELQNEKIVICQEIKRKFDNAHALAHEKLLELSFSEHPIRRWRIGTEEQVIGFSRDEILSYFNSYYVPENTIVSVVGNFDVEHVLAEITKQVAHIPKRSLPVRQELRELSVPQARLKRMEGDVSTVIVKLGFKAPNLHQDGYFAASVLSILLGKGRSSRLYRSLKEEQNLVDTISTSYSALGSTGFFSFDLEVKAEHVLSSQVAIWKEITQLAFVPPSNEDIEKVSRLVESHFYRDQEDVMGQAQSLAYYEQFGGFDKLDAYPQKMRDVSSADVVRMAQTLFTWENMSILEYFPKNHTEPRSDCERLSDLEKKVTPLIQTFSKSSTERAAPVKTQVFNHILSSTKLPDSPREEPWGSEGRFISYRNTHLPLVSLSLMFPGGRLNESFQNQGLTQFMLKNTLKGTRARTADDIAFSLESMGAGLSYDASADSIGYNLNVLARDFERGVALLADVMCEPLFLESEIEKEKRFTLAAVKRSKDDMFRYPLELFYQGLFGSHSYGFSKNGTESSIVQFSREAIHQIWRESFDWNRMVISIAGNVDHDEVLKVVNQYFPKQSVSRPASQIVSPYALHAHAYEKSESRDKQQTGLVIGFPGMISTDSKYPSLEVMRNILSGMGGRLFTNIREKNSLAYTVAAMNSSLAHGGAFLCYAGCSPSKEEEVKSRIIEELHKISQDLVSDEELRISKAYTKGSYLMSMQGTSSLAYLFASLYLSQKSLSDWKKYPLDIESVSRESVREAARSVIDLEKMCIGVVRGKL